MWIAENLSKNSINKPTAESGNVVMSEIGNNAIIASGEHIGLDFVTPYGIVSIPPVKEKAVVLPLADKEVCVGVISEVSSVQPGEILLKSKGGAEVYLNIDISVDSGGRYIHISGDDEILQQAFFKISAKFAGFVYNRELGCEINKVDFDDENFQEKVNLIMSQALADFPTVTAKVLALRKPKFSIRLICNESVREEIINTDDYL